LSANAAVAFLAEMAKASGGVRSATTADLFEKKNEIEKPSDIDSNIIIYKFSCSNEA
jgi:hypothetical protein